MKLVFQAPALPEFATEAFVAPRARPAGAVFFKPLSAPGIYEDRIDLTIKSVHTTLRTYPYKRADESVN
jgi:hypothetical protein